MTVLCVGGRGELDDAAAAMLAQVLEVQGATALKASFADMEPAGIRLLELDSVDAVVVGFLNRYADKHARFLVRRINRARPALRVGVVFWSETGDYDKEATAKLAGDINADFVANGMVDAVRGALSDVPPVALKLAAKRRLRRRPPARKKVPLAVAS
jgi:hypothetical protein